MRSSTEHRYTIRQVIDLTGASEFLIRTWELRYHALNPKRTDTGRRVYSEKDVLKIRALLELTRESSPARKKISDIANLKYEQLQSMLQERTTLTVPSKDNKITRLIEWIDQYQWDDLEASFEKNRKKMKPGDFIHEFILALIRETNNQVMQGRFTIAQEHILSAMIKENLMLLKASLKIKPHPQKFVIASPEGDHHDIGLMIASTLISISGKRGYYLGPNMPKSELCTTALRLNASHVVIASTLSKAEGAKDDFLSYLHFLDHHLPKKTVFILAGRNTAHLDANLIGRTVHFVRDFHKFERLL